MMHGCVMPRIWWMYGRSVSVSGGHSVRGSVCVRGVLYGGHRVRQLTHSRHATHASRHRPTALVCITSCPFPRQA